MLTPALSNQPVLFGSTAVMMSNEATKPSNECIGINASCSTTTSSICPKQLHMRKAFPDDYHGVRFTTCYGHVQKAEDTLTVYFTTKKKLTYIYIYIHMYRCDPLRIFEGTRISDKPLSRLFSRAALKPLFLGVCLNLRCRQSLMWSEV